MEEEILGIITLFFFFSFHSYWKVPPLPQLQQVTPDATELKIILIYTERGNWMNWIFFLKRTIKSSVENNLHLRFLFHSSCLRRILKLYSIEISTLKRYPSCIYYPNPYSSLFPPVRRSSTRTNTRERRLYTDDCNWRVSVISARACARTRRRYTRAASSC